MMYGLDFGVVALWMILIRALPFIALVALVAALAKNKGEKLTRDKRRGAGMSLHLS